jgi:ferritin heavy chain
LGEEEEEERVVVPWALSDFSDYTLSDPTLRTLLNRQINLELQAFYVYLSMAYYFNRDDIGMGGFFKFFKGAGEEEYKHATGMMDFMLKRGAPIHFSNITVPCVTQLLDGENEVPKTSHSTKKECHSLQAKIIRKTSTMDSGQVGCEWGDPLSAVTAARQLELNVYRHLKRVHLQADKLRDVQTQDFLDDYLSEQTESIKELSDLISQLKRTEPCLGYHIIDKELEGKEIH